MKIKFQNKNYKNAENQYLCDIAKTVIRIKFIT